MTRYSEIETEGRGGAFLGKKTKKQFVVIAAGGGNKYNKVYTDALVALALPAREVAAGAE